MKINKYILPVLAGITLTFSSCDNGFEDLNTDPNNPVVVPSNLLLTQTILTAGNENYNTFSGGDMGMNWAQHWTKVDYNDEEMYFTRPTVISNTWREYYQDLLNNAQKAYETAESEGNPAMMGAAQVMKSYGFQVLTDLYGPIPYTEALDVNNINPVYDSQQTVYNGLVNDLAEADALLAEGGTINATSDIMFGGDISKWRKFANTLSFRILMRTSYAQDVSSQLQDLLDNRVMMSSNEDNAQFTYLSEPPNANPFYETIVNGVREEWKVNSAMIDRLIDLEDPRLAVYAQPLEDGTYRGKPSGINTVPNDDYNFDNVSAVGEFYLNPTLPAVFLSYSEFSLLKAEAANRGLINGDAETFYNEGVTANMKWNEISSDDITAYLDNAGDFDGSEDQIALQNWIALYGQGFEAYTEWRRTKSPELQPAIDGLFNQIPSRWRYPSEEQTVNVSGYATGVSLLGSDEFTTDLWFMNN